MYSDGNAQGHSGDASAAPPPAAGSPANGRLSLGRAAVSQACWVALTPAGLQITDAGGDLFVWPFASLKSSVPVSRVIDDVVVWPTHEHGVALYLSDHALIDDLANHAPALALGRSRWRWAKPGLGVAAVVASLAGLLVASKVSPAAVIAGQLPQATRVTFGQNVIKSMSGDRKACAAQAGIEALRALDAKLLALIPDSGHYRITVIDWSAVNAYTAPGGQIIVTRGLIDKAQSPEEVAGVIAHELGHAIERHPEIGVIRVLGLSAASELMLGGSSGTVGNIGIVLAQLSYSRDAEREADQHAFRLLKAAKISPKGIAAFFARLSKSHDTTGSSTMDVLASHPATSERAALAAAQPEYPTEPILSDAQWQELKKICVAVPVVAKSQVLPSNQGPAVPLPVPPLPPAQAPSPAAAQDAENRVVVEATRALLKNPNDEAAFRRRAAAFAKLRNFDAAASDWTSSLKLKPEDYIALRQRASAKFSANDNTGAIQDFTASLKSKPGDAYTLGERGRAYFALKQFPEATADFRAAITLQPTAVSHHNLGLALLQLNQVDEATASFTAAFALDKDYVTTLYNRGLAHEKAGRRNAAIADYRSVIAMPVPAVSKYANDTASRIDARNHLKALGVEVPATGPTTTVAPSAPVLSAPR